MDLTNVRTRKFFYALLFFITACGVSFAQDKEVKGTVKDGFGIPLPGVNVILKGTKKGIQTDLDGHYKIKAHKGDVLMFSFLGMKTQEIKVENSELIDVLLEDEAQELEHVVVTGYNTRSKDVVAASVTTIGGENLTKLTPSTSMDNMLQGKATGVDVTALNGKPGQTATIKVRGAVSLNSKGGDKSQPLYVVDGVFVSESDLNILNPNDIETISILKDAASTAIYGSRGANGVVVVTTKQGKKGGAKISYSARTGFGEKIKDPFEMMNAQEKIEYELAANPAAYARTDEEKARDLSYQHDWADAILRKSQITSHVLSVSGATDNGAYFLSGGWDKNTGIVRNNDGFNRYTARLNFNTKMSQNLKVGINSSVAHTKSDELRDRNNTQNPFRAMYVYNPFEPVFERNPDGSYVRDTEGNQVYNATRNGLSVIEAMINAPSTDKITQFVGSAFAEYEFIKDFTYTTRYSGNYRRLIRESYTMPGSILDGYVGDPKAPGSKGDSGRDSYSYTWLNQLGYKKTFGEHNLNATIFSEFTDNYYHSYNFRSKGYRSKLLNTQENGSKPESTRSSKGESALLSLAAAVEYDYQGKYLASASVRRDGASRFGSDKRFGTFWSASAGWNITKEEFLSQTEWLDNLKLTASYGTTGNWNIPNYASQGYYLSASYDGTPAGIMTTNISNPELTWETQKSWNVGLESEMLQKRVSFTASYFNNDREDFLFETPLPEETGGYTKYFNTGRLTTSGLELSLSVDVIKTSDFKWNLSGNITFVDYKIKELDGQDQIVTDGIAVLKTGETPFTFYMPRYAGVNPDNGDALYYDKNGVITNNFAQASHTVLSGKSPLAKQYGGLNTSISYKGIDLTADFSFKLGNYSYNYVAYNLLSDGDGVDGNQRRDALDYWKKPGDNKLPRLNGNSNHVTDRFLQDASYLRFRTLTLGYTLPKDFVKGFSSARIFVQGQNLLTWSKFEGDPEVSIGSGENQLGTNQLFVPGLYYLYSYPTLRSFTLGIDITF